MKIGLDLDNVCVTTTEAVIEYLNERFPLNLKIEDINNYWIENFLPEQFKWAAAHAFVDKKMWQKVKMVKGAAENIKKLYEYGHEIYFVTSSLPENLRKKIKHLQRNLDFLPKNFVQDRTINIKNKQLLNLDVLVDDFLGNLGGKRKYTSICFDYPWNRNDEEFWYDDNFIRVSNWEQVYKEICKLDIIDMNDKLEELEWGD